MFIKRPKIVKSYVNSMPAQKKCWGPQTFYGATSQISESTSKYGFFPRFGGKNGGVLSMRMQVILDSSFARPGSAPIWGGKKGEFRDWTKITRPRLVIYKFFSRSTNIPRGLSTYKP